MDQCQLPDFGGCIGVIEENILVCRKYVIKYWRVGPSCQQFIFL